MSVRHFRTLALTGSFVLSLLAPAGLAYAQSAPAPQPPEPPQAAVPQATPLVVTARDAAIVRPLAEIGRVRSRTPYCAALAKARPGIDAAITFEYLAPAIAKDLRAVRFDSELHRELALRKVDTDLASLGEMASRGRAEVLALRTAANAEPDETKRNEMLALANAMDGAKERQKFLAKQIARTVSIFHEVPIRTVATTAADDAHSSGAMTKMAPVPTNIDNTSGNPETPIGAVTVTEGTLNALDQHDRAQTLFSTFGGERFILSDMQDAAKHAKTVMQIGGCSPN